MRAVLQLASALILIAAIVSCGGSAGVTPSPSPTTAGLTTITFTTGAGGSAELRVETASTPDQRQRGLMLRDSLSEDQGMLFVFPEDTRSAFWMKDTKVPLSIAFISAAGVIVDIQDMQPLTEDFHYSRQPYRYAVESNQGWFAEHGVVAGGSIGLPAATP